jgi:hypothetical protein
MKCFVVLSCPEPKGGSFVNSVAFNEQTAMDECKKLNKIRSGHWYREVECIDQPKKEELS